MLLLILKIIFYIPYRLIFWSKWINKKALKKFKGKPVILAFNHKGAMDGVSAVILINRKVYCWAKKEVFNSKLSSWFFNNIGLIPVKGGMDLDLIRKSSEILSKNKALVLYPEGHRSFSSSESLQLKNGVSMIALRTGVPILPIITDRVIKPFRLTKFKVGEPIDVTKFLVNGKSTKEGVSNLSNTLSTQMQDMLKGFEKQEKQPAWVKADNIIGRGIVIHENKLLVIEREKNNLPKYYVLPGGHLEEGETVREGCDREVLEETGVSAKAFRDLYKYWYIDKHGRGDGWQTFCVCEYQSGEPHKTDAEEYTEPNRVAGTYNPVWLDLSEIKKVDLRPACMKKQLIKDLKKKGTRLPFPIRKIGGDK